MWSYEEFLEYWFGPGKGVDLPSNAQFQRWFDADRKFDRELRRRFMTSLVLAAEGGLDNWLQEAHGCLAIVILLDQVSRRIYRGTSMAYDNNKAARSYSLQGIDEGLDQKLTTVQRIFFYQPFTHSERKEDQKLSLSLYQTLLDMASVEERSLVQHFVNDASRRNDMVQRFGRFPHRNKTLKRASRPEEEIFLGSHQTIFRA